jgi:ATP-dependent DNA ligase
MEPTIPTIRKDPFDDAAWMLELKFDGFRGLADTVNCRMLSNNRNHMKRYGALLAALPGGCILDSEIVVLGAIGA